MFRAVRRSSSGALNVFAASGLHTHVWVETQIESKFPLRLDYGRSPHAYVNQRLQIQLELLMTSGVPLETCWAFNEPWNNKFCYKVSSCWLFLLNHTRMHGSMNIKREFNVWQFYWEHTGILLKYVIVDKMKNNFFSSNFRAMVCVNNVLSNVWYLQQYLCSK